ncbi:uncharacterized protein LOC126484539 [Schistocerca serialis cubense]|uniref:uncharacterized protein LOC126484539 n=1 Tax=Schistocerca serialis cubense TaxID=2023355 RepID=UPI00214ED95A|nr:uncharacterized protein LOC126484539 [Schistocerca serialis cubense]
MTQQMTQLLCGVQQLIAVQRQSTSPAAFGPMDRPTCTPPYRAFNQEEETWQEYMALLESHMATHQHPDPYAASPRFLVGGRPSPPPPPSPLQAPTPMEVNAIARAAPARSSGPDLRRLHFAWVIVARGYIAIVFESQVAFVGSVVAAVSCILRAVSAGSGSSAGQMPGRRSRQPPASLCWLLITSQ